MITKILFGKTNSNQDVFLYALSNKNDITIEILDFGGIIKSIKMPNKNSKIEEISIGFDSLEPYFENSPYLGSIVGRHAGRIKNAKFNMGGKTFELAKNDGEHHLHGGVLGFSKKVWDSEIKDGKLVLSYFSPDCEENYPGNMQINVIYSLDDDNKFLIEYFAKSDKDTIINLTNHAYFNLSGEDNIENHTISINAGSFIPVDKEFIPTGEISDVVNTPFDIREAIKIGERISKECEQLKNALGFDHDFILNQNDLEKSCCTLFSEKSGRMIEVFTTNPCLHLYTGNFLDGGIAPYRGGLCLETQGYSDSVNNLNFKSSILKAGEVYSNKTIYKFSVKSGR